MLHKIIFGYNMIFSGPGAQDGYSHKSGYTVLSSGPTSWGHMWLYQLPDSLPVEVERAPNVSQSFTTVIVLHLAVYPF